jgi:hypothetical protein
MMKMMDTSAIRSDTVWIVKSPRAVGVTVILQMPVIV